MAKKSKFQQQLTEARRTYILDAAIAVIAEQGFQRTTIKQIAARAEVADGTIYNYFKNKDDILLAIIAQITEAETREIHFAEAEKIEFGRFVHDYIAHRMAEIHEGYPVLKVLISETLANPALAGHVYEQVYAPSFTVAEAYMQQLIDAGALPDVDAPILSRLFAAPLLGLLLLRMLGDEQVAEKWDAYSELMGSWMVRMLAGASVSPDAQSDTASDATSTVAANTATANIPDSTDTQSDDKPSKKSKKRKSKKQKE